MKHFCVVVALKDESCYYSERMRIESAEYIKNVINEALKHGKTLSIILDDGRHGCFKVSSIRKIALVNLKDKEKNHGFKTGF